MRKFPTRNSIGCRFILLGSVLLFYSQLMAQGASSRSSRPASVILERKYKLSETLSYEMKGSNHGWEYQIQANDLVKKDPEGVFYEQIGWSNLRSNAPLRLSPPSLEFRQTL